MYGGGEWEDVLLKSGCCQGFGDSYSGVGAVDAAQDKMGIDDKREKKKNMMLTYLFIWFTL